MGAGEVKESKRDTVLDVQEGDLVAFVYSISWLNESYYGPCW